MAKEYAFVAYFYDADRMEKEWSDAMGQLDAIKLGMKPKKADKAKVKAALDKEKKKGEYVLKLDGDVLSFGIRIGGTRFWLAKLDLAAVKDLKKRRDLLFQLENRTDLVTKADLAAFDKQHADPEDSAEAEKMGERIDELKRIIDGAEMMLGAANYKGKEYHWSNSELGKWLETKGFQRYKLFVDEIDNGRPPNGEGAKVLTDRASGIKVDTLKAIKAAFDKGDKPDYTQARKEVIAMINSKLIPQYNKEKIAEHQGKIKVAKAEIAALEKRLAVMKAD
jgi:hypothetical protein